LLDLNPPGLDLFDCDRHGLGWRGTDWDSSVFPEGSLVMKRRLLIGFCSSLTLVAMLSGCTTATSPATGRSFSTSVTPQQEAKIGQEEHPKILAEFGGAYGEKPELTKYVSSIGDFVSATAERKDVTYTFTVLNTPDVNAFAVPGGYIYITRGLLTLASNEAEVAGVLGHEIGHINARHTAERMGQQQNAQLEVLGATLLGAILGGNAGASALGGAVQQHAEVQLASYSQQQDFEADSLGVRYLKRATYDPQAMAEFLGSLRAESQLEAKLAGKDPAIVDANNMMASHPRTVDRVQKAIAEAGPADPNAMLEPGIYLQKIDGMMFGDDPKEGVIDGRKFIHPGLHFSFVVPQGFHLVNSSSQVQAGGPKGAVMAFELADPQPKGELTDYIASGQVAKNVTFKGIQALRINGMEAATGTTRVNLKEGETDARVVLVKHPEGTVYQFLFLTDPGVTAKYDGAFVATAQSFQQIAASEGSRYRQQRIHIVKVKSGDTVATLSSRMVMSDGKEDWFRVLNELKPGEELQPGRLVKIVTY
jgi:predicted Zn-dependent protease